MHPSRAPELRVMVYDSELSTVPASGLLERKSWISGDETCRCCSLFITQRRLVVLKVELRSIKRSLAWFTGLTLQCGRQGAALPGPLFYSTYTYMGTGTFFLQHLFLTEVRATGLRVYCNSDGSVLLGTGMTKWDC